MGEVAGMAPRFLGLALIVIEQLIELLDERADLVRKLRLDPRADPRADRRHGPAQAAQRPQAVGRLQRGEDQQAEP